MLTIHNADNLDVLRDLAARGEKFDLVELDGPYGAGLEGWDVLTEDEYLAHYAERLTLVRQILQP
jgi:23S rRNA G2069 N7-methylase RlmK/C1962 C5-methylase RlmI